MKLSLLFSAALTAAALASCGSTIGQMQTYNCCLNKEFYVCPDQDSFTLCFNDKNPSACTRDTTKDVGCPALWPSGP